MNGLGSVGIVGAGVFGRCLALGLSVAGWDVSLWDRGNEWGTGSCSYVGAGMLAPYCELESADPAIARMGLSSLALWPKILEQLNGEIFFQREGTLVVAHPSDRGELEHLTTKVAAVFPGVFRPVEQSELKTLEPELDPRFMSGVFFPHEGQIDGRDLLVGFSKTLKRRGVRHFFGEEVVRLGPREIVTLKRRAEPEWVIDCRGLSAKPELEGLRGVRGEILTVEAPDVRLNRPIRVMHPRYPLYIVPRPHGRFLVGATLIESDDRGPVSVRSTLELLSAAFGVHAGLGEGRITETAVHCRPAFSDNLPRIVHAPGLLRINGLYRHGFLLSPHLAEVTRAFLSGGKPASEDASLFVEAG